MLLQHRRTRNFLLPFRLASRCWLITPFHTPVSFQTYAFKKRTFQFTCAAKCLCFYGNRLVNGAATLNLALSVVDGAGKPACDILEIAVDGIYLDRGRRQRLGRSFLMTSTRIDWLIVCNKPGEYYVSLQNSLSFFWYSSGNWICIITIMVTFFVIVCCWLFPGIGIQGVQLLFHQVFAGWLAPKIQNCNKFVWTQFRIKPGVKITVVHHSNWSTSLAPKLAAHNKSKPSSIESMKDFDKDDYFPRGISHSYHDVLPKS